LYNWAKVSAKKGSLRLWDSRERAGGLAYSGFFHNLPKEGRKGELMGRQSAPSSRMKRPERKANTGR